VALVTLVIFPPLDFLVRVFCIPFPYINKYLIFPDAGARVTFLLRSPAIFDGDENIQKHIKDDKVCLLKGDGLVKEDVQRAWDEAGKAGPVDVLLFSVGMFDLLSLYS
jgi:hypothetical protein